MALFFKKGVAVAQGLSSRRGNLVGIANRNIWVRPKIVGIDFETRREIYL